MPLHETSIDVADIRQCSRCGRDYLHLTNVDGIGVTRCEPFVAPAADVAWGWKIRDRHWVIHCGAVSPLGYAFPEHDCTDEGTTRVSDGWDDPFDVPEKRPSISFKDAPAGAAVTCKVVATPRMVQARNIDTGMPETWDDGNPKLNAVIDVEWRGEARSLWAKKTRKEGSLFMAIAKAQDAAGQKIREGGTLTITVTGYEPNENPRLSPRRLYAASYEPGSAFDDPWSATPAQTASDFAAPAAAPEPTTAAAGTSPAPWD